MNRVDAVGNWGGISKKKDFMLNCYDQNYLPFETDVIASVWFKSAITAASESDRVRPTGCDVVGVDVPLVSLGESDDACVVRTGALIMGFLNYSEIFKNRPEKITIKILWETIIND